MFRGSALPSEADPRLRVPVLLFALLTTTGWGLLFGSVPAWYASRVNLNQTLKKSGRTSARQRPSPAAPGPRGRQSRGTVVTVSRPCGINSLELGET